MGLTKVTAKITNLEGKKPGYEALFLVDTGAIHCLAPGNETVTPVIFGPDNVEPILGVLALESTGIGVDPVTTTLKRMPAISLKIMKNEK